MRKMLNTIKAIVDHVKRNIGLYTILASVGYVIYQVYKMVSDKGTTSSGEPYYKEFEEPEDEVIDPDIEKEE